jgi:hypothetical protein
MKSAVFVVSALILAQSAFAGPMLAASKPTKVDRPLSYGGCPDGMVPIYDEKGRVVDCIYWT